jgi:gamma-glutamyltranspeptidase/glutathione hydrolase
MLPFSHRQLTRRDLLSLAGRAGIASVLTSRVAHAATATSANSFGAVVGDRVAARTGEDVLRAGGNAIDAAIAAAFVAGIAAPHNCGIGGYGGHAVVALAGGKKIAAIDFNSTAPSAAQANMFPLDPAGRVQGNANQTGWLAAGVPGTLAGLELTLQRFGTRSLRDMLEPAIALCEKGTHASRVKGIDDTPRETNQSSSDDSAPVPREKRRNAALARLLKTLAARNSAESFYRGDLAATIADAFQQHGGLVTRADLAAYQARELAPLTLDWNGMTLHTMSLTSSGPLVIQALTVLKALDWPKLAPEQRQHARLEALRIAWADRLRYFGDPDFVSVPLSKLLSASHAGELAERVMAAVKAARPVPLEVQPSRADGTTNISAVDRAGNMIAITLTHGGSYGARVVVDELGVVLGHGMSRFDPRPGFPNSPGPGKRPMTNMCPAIVTRGGSAVLALGGAGGTRIPNSIHEVLLNYLGLGATMEAAMTSPRIDTQGTLTVGLDTKHSPADEAFFKSIGYATAKVTPALVSAVEFDPTNRNTRGMTAGGA